MTSFGFGAPTINAWLFRPGHPPLDMRPYLLYVDVAKDMSQPAGTWELHLAYAPDAPTGSKRTAPKALIDHIEPNDYVTIHIQNKPGEVGYWMRGFIDNAELDEDAGSTGGDMQRYILLNGRDYGGLLQNFQISYIDSGQDIARTMTGANLARALGYKDNLLRSMGAAEFVRGITEKILDANHITNMRVYNTYIEDVKTGINVPHYFGANTTNQTLQMYSGTLDDLIRQVQSPPWAEYFVRDDEDGPRLYYRMAPYLTWDGHFGWDTAAQTDLRIVSVSPREVMTSSLARSQNEVWTYFLTTPTVPSAQDLGTAIVGTGTAQGKGLGNPYYDGAAGSGLDWRSRQFGFRPLEPQSPWILGDPQAQGFVPFQTDPSSGLGTTQWWTLLTKMNLWLVHTMGHNEELKSGTLVSRGCHGVRIGDYIHYQRDPSVPGDYIYVQGVELEWSSSGIAQQQGPDNPIVETLTLVRGQPRFHHDPQTRSTVPPPTPRHQRPPTRRPGEMLVPS